MTCIMKASFALHSHLFLMHTNTLRLTGEGHFDDGSNKPSGAATPMEVPEPAAPERGREYRRKLRQRSKGLLLQTDQVHNGMYGKKERNIHSMYRRHLESRDEKHAQHV